MNTQGSFQNLKCAKNLAATHSCLNKKCQKHALICSRQQCQCQQDHEDCPTVKVKTILKKINDKVISTKTLQQCIEKGIENLIDKLSEFKDLMLVNIKRKFQFLGLSSIEKQILKNLKQGKTDEIIGSKIWEAHLGFQKQTSIESQIRRTIKNINASYSNFQKQFQKPFKKIQKYIEQLSSFNDDAVNKSLQVVISKQQLTSMNFRAQLSAISKIFTNPEQIKIIWDFFSPRKISSFKFLFRASQNQFDVQKFYKKCLYQQNTLIVSETEMGKKIGAFTPLRWEYGSNNYITDESGQSFIFSLSNNDKFVLSQKNKAVVRYSQNSYKGPTFGSGPDLYIANKSNQNSDSIITLNKSYINSKFKQNDKELYQRFTGNPQGSNKFKLKQWQVWQLQFTK